MGKKLRIAYKTTVFLIIPLLMFSVIHEQRHKTIAENYGCQAQINYIPQPQINAFMYTSITDCPDLSETELEAMRTQQAQVETTGYQLLPILMMLILTVTVLDTLVSQNMEQSRKIEQRNKIQGYSF